MSAGRAPAAMSSSAFTRHSHRLAALFGRAPDLNRSTRAAIRDQLFLDACCGTRDGDHGARCGDDLVGAPVVVGEHELAVLRVLAREPVEVGAACAAELVDGLVVVGDHEKVAVPCDERLHELRLCVVGVLVLIDHHVADAIRDRAAHGRLLADQALRIEDAVVEVKDPGAPVALVEARVDAGHVLVALQDDLLSRVIATLEPCHRPRGVGIRSDQFLFRGADDLEERVHEVVRAQRIPEQWRAELIEDRLHVKPPLGRVGDAEHRGYSEQPAPLTHDAESE